MNENIFIKDKISKLFIQFSTPAIICMLISGLQIIIDGIFVGNVVGSNAMASVNISQPFMQVIIGFSMILSIGAQSFIGRTLGEGDNQKAKNIFKTAIILTLIIGSIVTLSGIIFSKEIALLLGANEVLLNYTSTYIKTIAIFAIPMSLMFLFGFIDRILERPEIYFKGMILSLLMNIMLNYVLIYKFKLETLGAAVATGLSYSSALIMVIWPVINKKNVLNIFDGKFDKTTIKTTLYNGSSEGITAIATATTSYIFNTAFMQIAGEAGVAAFTAINYVLQFQVCVMFGISDGIVPIVSYNYGSGSIERVNEILKLSAKVIISIAVVSFLVLYMYNESIIEMFVKGDKNILNLASNGAKILSTAFLLNGFNIVYSGYFTAIGFAKESAIVSASRGIIFIFIGAILLPRIFGVSGVWMSIPFAEVCTFIIGTYMFIKSKLVAKTLSTV